MFVIGKRQKGCCLVLGKFNPKQTQSTLTRLEVAVHNVKVVNVLDRERDLGRVEASPVLGELADLAEVEEEFATCAIVEDKVQLVFRLERHVESDYEGVLDVAEDRSLGPRVLDLVPLDNIVLLEDLEGEHLGCLLLPNQENLACFHGEFLVGRASCKISIAKNY